MCFQCCLLSLFAAQKVARRQKMHFPPQLKTTSLRHLFLQVTALWHRKIIKWMSPILLIEWGQHPLGRKRENNMQSCGHRLHIWDILQLWNIWFFGRFTKPFLHAVFVTPLCPPFSFPTPFACHSCCFTSATGLKSFGAGNMSREKSGWQPACKQHHSRWDKANPSHPLSINQHFNKEDTTALGKAILGAYQVWNMLGICCCQGEFCTEPSGKF